LPIIAVYPGYDSICAPQALSPLWPAALATRINSGTAKVIHIPFKQIVVDKAIRQFHIDNMPQGGLTYYTREAYASI
jgi:hypothetical protein